MFRCVHCKKTNSVKAGLRKNRGGFVQKYFCNECGRTFTDRKGFERMRTNPEIIVTALDLRAQGLSYGEICKHIMQKYNKKVSRKTVLDWQNKFGEMIDHFTKSFQLSHSFSDHADDKVMRFGNQLNLDEV
ncbi:IS1 family transposase [Candidatus Woesearchaeota archaeon]|nr:IS1 family transposase [Candidatus Woesearchaeota archaeon]